MVPQMGVRPSALFHPIVAACATVVLIVPLAAYATPELRISGIGVEIPDSQSWAIVEVNNTAGEVYYVGDTIPGVGSITGIRKNCVDFLSKDGAAGSACLQSKQIPSDVTAKLHPASSSPPQSQPSTTRPHQLQTGELLNLSARDHIWLGEDGRWKTVYGKDGQAKGLLIESTSGTSVLSGMGFRNGDQILTLNGRTIGTVEDLSRSVLQFKGEAIEFEMIQDDQRITRDIRISDSTLTDIERMEKGM